jgi:predicted RNase H-like nuclease
VSGTSRLSRGPQLPYQLLAGVEPCPGGWLLASAKLVGTTCHAERPRVVPTFREILESVPSYAAIAVHIPVGLPAVATTGGRSAEREARRLLGFPRRGAILSAPTRRALAASDDYEKASALNGGHLDYITWRMLPKVREIADEVQSYHQRTVFEVSPELTYFSINGNRPMRYPKRTYVGQGERREVLGNRVQGIQNIFNAQLPRVRHWHLTDVAADLWTARRILGKGIHRLPEQPEWNDDGLRMEIVY